MSEGNLQWLWSTRQPGAEGYPSVRALPGAPERPEGTRFLRKIIRQEVRIRIMCSPALCETCNKVTWAGCGQHIEEALDGVPEEQLCKCEAN
jgi:hypothetical protein